MIAGKLKAYPAKALKVATVYTCSLNTTGPIVGFKVKLPGTRYTVLISKDELIELMREKGDLANVGLFITQSKDGLQQKEYRIRSKEKNFSLTKGQHVVNINDLQKRTWSGKIDQNNKVQKMFTSYC